MLILGIETSCDETAAAVLEIKNGDVKVLSNIVSSQVKLHAKFGGVVPSLAAREHVRNLPKVIKLALKTGNCKLKNIDLIAATRGPGLISSLLVGTTFAKTLAWKYNKPIIGVNHLEGHIASNWLLPVGEIPNQSTQLIECSAEHLPRKCSGSKFQIPNSIFPVLCLIVSGGHTELVLMKNFGNYKIVGQTLDDAAGEAFDKIARILGLGYPGGPAISAEAERLVVGNKLLVIGKNQKTKLPTTNYQLLTTKLPRPMINSKDFNFSFAGLKTAVLYLVRDLIKSKLPQNLSELNSDNYQSSTPIDCPQVRAAIASETQQAIVDVLVSKTIKAAEKYKVKSIMLSGGVSDNKLLRSNLNKAAEQRGLKFFKPEMEYTTDNAAMIALAGFFSAKGGSASGRNYQKKKKTDWKSVKVDANLTI